MSNLRDTLLEIQREKTLKLLLADEYENASEEKKKHYLRVVDKQIEHDVDKMLQDFIISYKKDSPEAKKNRSLRWFYIILNVILTPGIAYAVNKEEWLFLAILSILMVVNQSLPHIYEKD